MRKKIIVIGLSILMLFSTFLFCGFSLNPVIEEDKLPVISDETTYINTIYFDTTISSEDLFNLFEQLPFIPFEAGIEGSLLWFNGSDKALAVTHNLSSNLYFVLYGDFYNNDTEIIINSNTINSPDGITFYKTFLDINSYGVDTLSFMGQSLPVGSKNGILTDFIYVESYTSSDGVYIGKGVNPYSELDNIYFNNDISPKQFAYSLLSISSDYITGVESKFTVFSDSLNELLVLVFNNGIESALFVTYGLVTNFDDADVIFGYDFFNDTVLFDNRSQVINVNSLNNSNLVTSFEFNTKISSLISSVPIFFGKPTTVGESIVNVITSVIFTMVPSLVNGIGLTFSNLFIDGQNLSVLGSVFMTFIGIGLCVSIFRVVYKIFRNRIKTKV